MHCKRTNKKSKVRRISSKEQESTLRWCLAVETLSGQIVSEGRPDHSSWPHRTDSRGTVLELVVQS